MLPTTYNQAIMQTSSRKIFKLATMQRGLMMFLRSPSCQSPPNLGQLVSEMGAPNSTRTLASCHNSITGQFREFTRSRAIVPFSPSHMTTARIPVQQSFSTCRQCLGENSSKEVTNRSASSIRDDQVMRVAASEHHQHFSSRNASAFDKKLLVFFKKYKTVEEVPALVSVHLLNSTRNKFRIYVNIFIGFLTMSSCVFMIYRGHSRAGQGETLSEHNMRRHPEHYKKQLKA